MWWVIGIIGATLLYFIVGRFRAASQKNELATVLLNHLGLSFRMMNSNPLDRTIRPDVWSDTYLLGYAYGSAMMLFLLFGNEMQTSEKGMIQVDAFKELAGDKHGEALEKMVNLNGSGDPEFTRGSGHGSDVIALMFNQAGPELLADLEVQAALREAPQTIEMLGEVGKSAGPLADAGGVLLHTYMSRHKVEAGY